MKKERIAIVYNVKSGNRIPPRRRYPNAIIKDDMVLDVINQDLDIPARFMLISVHCETIKLERHRAKNRDYIYVQEGIDPDRAEEFYKNSF